MSEGGVEIGKGHERTSWGDGNILYRDGVCIGFFFLYFDVLIFWALLTLEDSPSQDYLIPRIAYNSPARVLFKTKSPNPKPTLYILYGALTFKATIPLPKSPQSQVSDNKEQPYNPEAALNTQASQSKPAYPASPDSSQGKHNKGSCSYFPPTPLPLDQHLHFPMWPWVE